MSKNTASNILGNPNLDGSSKASRTLRKYQLSWNPSFYTEDSDVYIIGEDLKFLNGGIEARTSFRQDPVPGTPDTGQEVVFSLNPQEFINLGMNNSIVLPLNTNIALAQEYSPSIKNKIVTYETVGGNSITTFGEAIRTLGMRIRIIKMGEQWKMYYKGLETLSYLSANQSRFYGGLYLTAFDSFKGDVDEVSYRYKVTILSLDLGFRSETNTTVTADLKLIVNQDLSRRRGKWGQL